jgi:ribonuclease HI
MKPISSMRDNFCCVWTDGSKHSSKQDDDQVGYAIFFKEGSPLNRSTRLEGSYTVPQAEILAVVDAIAVAPGHANIAIFSDNPKNVIAVFHVMSHIGEKIKQGGTSKAKATNNRASLQRLWGNPDWIYEGNEQVDKLAKNAKGVLISHLEGRPEWSPLLEDQSLRPNNTTVLQVARNLQEKKWQSPPARTLLQQ